MKKICYFFIFVFSLLIVSCNDDDNRNDSEEISKVYRGDKLELTLNGVKTNGKAIRFNTTDFAHADITLINTIPGEDSILVRGVALNKVGQDGSYSFSATDNSFVTRTIEFKGQIALGGAMKIDITHKLQAKAVGLWEPDADVFSGISPLSFRIVPSNPNDSIDMSGFYGYDGKMSYAEFDELMGGLAGLVFGMALKTQIEITPDAQLIASWEPGILGLVPLDPGQSKEGMVLVNIKDDMIYTAIAVDSIIMDATKPKPKPKATSEGDSNISVQDVQALIMLAQKAYQGLPFKTEFSRRLKPRPSKDSLDILTTKVDKPMMEPYFESIINVATPMLRDLQVPPEVEEMGISGPALAALAIELARVFRESKEFEIHLIFHRVDVAKSYQQKPPLSNQQFVEKLKELKTQINKSRK